MGSITLHPRKGCLLMPRALKPGERGAVRVSRYTDGTYRARGSVKLHDGSLYRGDQRGAERALAARALDEELDVAFERAGGDTALLGPWLRAWMQPRVAAAEDRKRPLPPGQSKRWSTGTAKAYRSAYRNIWPEVAPEPRHTKEGKPDARFPARSHVRGLGELPIEELSIDRIEAFMHSLLQGPGPGYRSCELAAALLTPALDEAVREGLLRANPMGQVRIPQAPERQELATLDAVTLDRVHDALTEYQQRTRVVMWGHGTRYTDAWTVLLGTGARIGEVLALRRCDVDVTAGLVRIRGTLTEHGKLARSETTKGGKTRTISVGPAAFGVLHRRVEELDPAAGPLTPVFGTRTGAFWAPSAFREGLRAARKAAGIDQDVLDTDGRLRRISPHALRRTAGTDIAEAYGVVAAARHLGHSSTRTTEESYIRHKGRAPDVSGALQ